MGDQMYEGWVLDIVWDESALPGLPRLVGPFGAMKEAQDWAAVNIPNGSATLHPLARPYARALVTSA